MKRTFYIIITLVALLFSTETRAQNLHKKSDYLPKNTQLPLKEDGESDFFRAAPPSPKYEVRAVWLTTISGLDWPKTKATNSISREAQKQELCEILDQLQACRINTVVLQTRIRGSVIYPSKIEPWDIRPRPWLRPACLRHRRDSQTRDGTPCLDCHRPCLQD